MISKKIVLTLSLCVAGSFIQLQGAACTSGATLATYITLGATGCEIGNLTFYNFGWTPSGASPTLPPGGGGLPAAQVDVTTLLNNNGVGFDLTPLVTWGAGGGGDTDGELQFIVKTTGGGSTLNHLYQQIDGTVVGTGSYDQVLEQYCLGGTSLPPCGPPTPQLESRLSPGGVCAPGSPDGSGGCENSVSFSGVSSISVLKDIHGDATAGATGANVTITGVINQFGPPVPEPGTYVLSFIGLGLLFLGKHKYSRL